MRAGYHRPLLPSFPGTVDTSSTNEIADFVEKGTDFDLSSSFKSVRETIL